VTARVLLAAMDDAVRRMAQASMAELSDIEVVGAVTTSNDVLAVLDTDLDIVFVHDSVGPLPFLALCRDIAGRRRDIAVVVMSNDVDNELLVSAMEAGVRAVVSGPPTVDELQLRLPALMEWVRGIRALSTPGSGSVAGARVLAFNGAKGGVGTSTIALHLALLAAKADRNRRVCLVDLDLQQRGLAHLLDIGARRSVVDLVPVADSISARALDETIFVHSSGLRLLPAPRQGEQAEDVTAAAMNQILAGLMGHYDLLIIDTGSTLTEVTAAALELAEDLLIVTTTDVASLRAARDKVRLVSRLQIAKEEGITTLVNRAANRQEVQPDLARRIVGTDVARVALPSDWKRLEPVTNSARPEDLELGPFRRAMTALATDLRLIGGTPAAPPAPGTPARGATGADASLDAAADPSPTSGRRRGRRRAGRRRDDVPADAGQIAVDGLVGLAGVFLVLLCLAQFVVFGYGTVLAQKAADSAARAAARAESNPLAAAHDAAGARLPDSAHYTVTSSGGSPAEYRVSVDVPAVIPGLSLGLKASAGSTAVN
jgi:pilus assembly protein CpaE